MVVLHSFHLYYISRLTCFGCLCLNRARNTPSHSGVFLVNESTGVAAGITLVVRRSSFRFMFPELHLLQKYAMEDSLPLTVA